MDLSVKLILVRHAETQGNLDGILLGHQDSPLTDLGKEQALATARELKGEKIDAICSSPLGRALETAQIIAQNLGNLEVKVEPLLIERDFGVLTSKHKNEIHLHAKELFQTSNFTYFLEAEGAEDFPTLLKRAEKAVSKINDDYKDKTALLVVHAQIGKMIEIVYHGWDWQKGLATPHFEHGEIIKLGFKD